VSHSFDLSEVPEVQVDIGGIRKYALVDIGFPREQPIKTVLWTDYQQNQHSSIVEKIQNLVFERTREPFLKVHCAGGGLLFIREREKVINIWDYSASYGAPPLDRVEELLKKSFPDFAMAFSQPTLRSKPR